MEKIKPYINNPGTKLKKMLGEFKGVYTAYGESACPEGYSPYMKNISACSYPAIESRQGREKIGQFSGSVVFLGAVCGECLIAIVEEYGEYEIMYLNGEGQWEYLQNAYKTDTGRYNMIYFINSNILISGTIYTMDGLDKSNTISITLEDGVPKIAYEQEIPFSDFIDTIGGRVAVALSQGDKIYLSGIMDRGVWYDIDDGLEVSMITQNCENISAIKTFGDHLLCFKPHAFGELYGNTPDTYTLIMASEQIGCIEEKTICDCGRLLWLSDEGICSYGGGTLPKIISEPVQKYIDNIDKSRIDTACAGYDGERYIISLPQKGGEKINLVLNVKTGTFAVEDGEDFRCFTNMGGELYGGTADGKIYKLFSGSEEVSWEWHSPLYKLDIESKTNLRRIYIDGDFTGSFSVSVINDKGTKTEKTFKVAEENKSGKQRFCIDLHPKNFYGTKSFQLVLKGEGAARVEDITLFLRKKNITYGGR